MPRFVYHTLSSDFSGVSSIEAMGGAVSGAASPAGVPGALYIQNGVMVSTIQDTDPLTFFGQRAEITGPTEPNAERWYCWEMLFPSDWIDTVEMTVQQIHDTPDGGDPARAPNFVLSAYGGSLFVTVPTATLPAESNAGTKHFACEMVKGAWVKYCLHINWQTGANGFRELFIDGVPVFRQFNVPTHYIDVVGPYFKLGLYNHGHVAGFGTRTARYRNVGIWTGNDGYSTVMETPQKISRQLLKN